MKQSDAKDIKKIRKHLKLTQQEFGVMLGFSEGGAKVRISELENGKMPLSKKTRKILEIMEKHKQKMKRKT